MLILIPFLFAQYVTAQSDSIVHQLETISVSADKGAASIQGMAPMQIIQKTEFSKLPSLQVSDVLKHLSGITLRDYGGVGGMKTISVRGFGSQHTLLAYDGVAQSDCQTGQLDLSRFSLDNVETISLITGSSDDIFLPARLFSSASLLDIKTVRPTFEPERPIHLCVKLLGGSFGLFTPSLLMENRIFQSKKTPLLITNSLYVNYLQSDGRYPFTLHYGGVSDSTSIEHRSNSDVHTLSVEENLFFDFNESAKLDFKCYYYLSDRGLPNAVIFYNSRSDERLSDNLFFTQAHFKLRFSKGLSYQLAAKFNYAAQHYVDPNYLNAIHLLDNKYIQKEGYLSNSLFYSLRKWLSFSFANDLTYNTMNANLTDFVFPSRFSVLSSLYMRLDTRYVDVNVGVLHSYIDNKTKKGKAAEDYNRFSPSVSVALKPIDGEAFYISAFYKDIFRLPTFNDLYYRLVGNLELKPENASQVGVGLAYEKKLKKWDFSIDLDGYYNRVNNKIVAIPNKSLFVWTMLNMGEVEMWGATANVGISYKIIPQLSLRFSANYSYQYAVDVTDKASKTYLHQLPYVPFHSGSGLFSVVTPWIEVSYTLLASGKRYALQQNIEANELEGYWDHGIVIGKIYSVKKTFELGFRLELLNLADNNYEIVRNYPMQGRSFRLSGLFKW